MRKKTTSRDLRVAEYVQLLEALHRQPMPVVCTTPGDVHRILALRSASLVEALMDPPEHLRSGELRIARAVVTAITAEGRNLLVRSARAGRSLSRGQSEPPPPAGGLGAAR